MPLLLKFLVNILFSITSFVQRVENQCNFFRMYLALSHGHFHRNSLHSLVFMNREDNNRNMIFRITKDGTKELLTSLAEGRNEGTDPAVDSRK